MNSQKQKAQNILSNIFQGVLIKQMTLFLPEQKKIIPRNSSIKYKGIKQLQKNLFQKLKIQDELPIINQTNLFPIDPITLESKILSSEEQKQSTFDSKQRIQKCAQQQSSSPSKNICKVKKRQSPLNRQQSYGKLVNRISNLQNLVDDIINGKIKILSRPQSEYGISKKKQKRKPSKKKRQSLHQVSIDLKQSKVSKIDKTYISKTVEKQKSQTKLDSCAQIKNKRIPKIALTLPYFLGKPTSNLKLNSNYQPLFQMKRRYPELAKRHINPIKMTDSYINYSKLKLKTNQNL